MNMMILATAWAMPLLYADAPMTLVEMPRIIEMQKVATSWRKKYDLPEQELDEECCLIAQRWANYMAANHRFHHGGGEQIIAVVYKDAEAAFGGWMSSGGHRAWLLSGSELCGWGCQQSSNGTWYWAGCFRNKKEEDK